MCRSKCTKIGMEEMKRILVINTSKEKVDEMETALAQHLREIVMNQKEEFTGLLVDEDQYSFSLIKAIGIGCAHTQIKLYETMDAIISSVGTPEDFPNIPFCSHQDNEIGFGDLDFLLELYRSEVSSVQ